MKIFKLKPVYKSGGSETHAYSTNKSKKGPLAVILLVLIAILITAGMSFGIYLVSKELLGNENPSNQDSVLGCKTAGCGGELCVSEDSEDIYSTCIYDPKNDCYKTAACERQQNGRCGWTQTSELQKCLEEYN